MIFYFLLIFLFILIKISACPSLRSGRAEPPFPPIRREIGRLHSNPLEASLRMPPFASLTLHKLSHASLLPVLFSTQLSSSLFFIAHAQNPVLEYQQLYETHSHYSLIWIAQNNQLHGSWLVEHSNDGLQWSFCKKFHNHELYFYHNFHKNLYGFIRIRWFNDSSYDTTTLAVLSFNHAKKKGLFASYDSLNCKITLGYQIPKHTDLLMRMYNSIGEEVATYFLYHKENELHFWNFELEYIKKDIYLVRIIDALTKEIIADYRLKIPYDAFEKKPN